MRSTEIDLYGIAHVKVDFIPVLKMCVLPFLGKFVWTIYNFGQCAFLSPTLHANSRKLIFRRGLLLSVLVVPSPSPCPSLGVMECQGSSEDEKSRSWVFDEWLLINVRAFLGKLMFYFVISVKFKIFYEFYWNHNKDIIECNLSTLTNYSLHKKVRCPLPPAPAILQSLKRRLNHWLIWILLIFESKVSACLFKLDTIQNGNIFSWNFPENEKWTIFSSPGYGFTHPFAKYVHW